MKTQSLDLEELVNPGNADRSPEAFEGISVLQNRQGILSSILTNMLGGTISIRFSTDKLSTIGILHAIIPEPTGIWLVVGPSDNSTQCQHFPLVNMNQIATFELLYHSDKKRRLPELLDTLTTEYGIQVSHPENK